MIAFPKSVGGQLLVISIFGFLSNCRGSAEALYEVDTVQASQTDLQLVQASFEELNLAFACKHALFKLLLDSPNGIPIRFISSERMHQKVPSGAVGLTSWREGLPLIELVNGLTFPSFIVLHEIGHTLGLEHDHAECGEVMSLWPDNCTHERALQRFVELLKQQGLRCPGESQ